MAVDSDVFRSPTPNYKENRRGSKAVSTPGNVNAWQAMSEEYGNLEWKQLFEPAIELASEGFVISEGLAGTIEYTFDSFPEHAKYFYGKDGEPLKAGDPLIQGDLAKSLRLIAEEGAKAVYGGEMLERKIQVHLLFRGSGNLFYFALESNRVEGQQGQRQ